MRWLLFSSRLAFICGIFFLLSLSDQLFNWSHDEAISSTIIIIGYAIGLVVVPFVNLSYLVLVITRRRPSAYVPSWLAIANFIFLLMLVLLIYLYTTYGQRYPAA